MKLSMEPSISGCKAGEREWSRWCLLLIQNMHTHFHWLTAQYWTYYRGKTPLFVCLSAGGYWYFAIYRSQICCVFNLQPPAGHKTIHSVFIQCCERTPTRTHKPFCTFYLQNVLKFSVQRLTNEVQQNYACISCSFVPTTMPGVFFFLLLQKVRRIQKRKKKLIYKRITRAGRQPKVGLWVAELVKHHWIHMQIS